MQYLPLVVTFIYKLIAVNTVWGARSTDSAFYIFDLLEKKQLKKKKKQTNKLILLVKTDGE